MGTTLTAKEQAAQERKLQLERLRTAAITSILSGFSTSQSVKPQKAPIINIASDGKSRRPMIKPGNVVDRRTNGVLPADQNKARNTTLTPIFPVRHKQVQAPVKIAHSGRSQSSFGRSQSPEIAFKLTPAQKEIQKEARAEATRQRRNLVRRLRRAGLDEEYIRVFVEKQAERLWRRRCTPDESDSDSSVSSDDAEAVETESPTMSTEEGLWESYVIHRTNGDDDGPSDEPVCMPERRCLDGLPQFFVAAQESCSDEVQSNVECSMDSVCSGDTQPRSHSAKRKRLNKTATPPGASQTALPVGPGGLQADFVPPISAPDTHVLPGESKDAQDFVTFEGQHLPCVQTVSRDVIYF